MAASRPNPIEHLDESARAKAFEDLVENVSVAGWKEAFGERIEWISHCFKAGLIILTGVSLYYCYGTVVRWRKLAYKDEIVDVAGLESIPFSNVTVCAQVYFNQDFVRKNVRVPPKVLQQYSKATGETVDEFYRQLTLFLSLTDRPRVFSSIQVTLFSKIVQANPQMIDYTTFADSATLACEEMFRKCWFNGKPFDCCERAVKSFDDDGICYLLSLNFNSDNAEPQASTISQTTPGPYGGLTMEAEVNVEHFPMLDEDAQNGFRVYASAHPFSYAISPAVAPHGAVTFIKMSSSKYQLVHNCVPHGDSRIRRPDFMYYDPQGFSCIAKTMMKLLRKVIQCDTPLFLHRPNNTMVCNPTILYFGTRIFTAEDAMSVFGELENEAVLTVALKSQREMENEYKQIFSNRARCPNHCRYWTYETSASFVFLEHTTSEQNFSSVMRSAIHVYYDNFGYRLHTETKENVYLLFYDLGNIFLLCWGMSVVSFFHIFFYVTRYFVVRRRAKRNVQKTTIKKIRKVQVAPQLETAL